MAKGKFKFDIENHYKQSAKFRLSGKSEPSSYPNPADRSRETTSPHIISHYTGHDVRLCGLNVVVAALLKTEFTKPPGIFSKKIKQQRANISLYFNTTKDGYEKPIEDPDKQCATDGSSDDRRKLRLGNDLAKALKEQLDAKGYQCKGNAAYFEINLTDSSIPPLEQFERINSYLQELEVAYERDKLPLELDGRKLKPLEDLRVETNPKLVAGKEPSAHAWRGKVSTPSLAEKIAALAETHFPTGKAVEARDHQDFRNAVSELISRERGS